MSATVNLEQAGFNYSGDYKCPCGSKYKIYRKSDLAGIEVRVKYTGETIKVFKNGKQIGVGNYSTIEKLLLNVQAV